MKILQEDLAICSRQQCKSLRKETPLDPVVLQGWRPRILMLIKLEVKGTCSFQANIGTAATIFLCKQLQFTGRSGEERLTLHTS